MTEARGRGLILLRRLFGTPISMRAPSGVIFEPWTSILLTCRMMLMPHRLIRNLAADRAGERTALSEAQVEIERLRLIVKKLQRYSSPTGRAAG